MVIGGLWHGAAWNFILWGFYQGALLVVHRFFKPTLDLMLDAKTRFWQVVSFTFRLFIFFHLTCYGWLLFRAESFHQIAVMTRSLRHPLEGYDPELALRILLIASPLIVVQLVQHLTKRLEFLNFRWIPAEARAVVYAVFVYLVVFRGGQPQAFIYFQF
jgi:hypothetical protein